MDNSPPFGTLLIESRIPIFPDLRLDYGAVSDYTFSVKNYNLYVYLKNNEIPVVDNRETTLDYFLKDEDQPYF
jgi:hypothetical protein